MSPRHHHHHGSPARGRLMVIVGCLIIIGANLVIFRDAHKPAHPLLSIQLAMAISLIWILAGAWGAIAGLVWGRVMMLTVLYIGTVAFFIALLLGLTSEESALHERIVPMLLGAVVYLVMSLFLTKSRTVRRLTNRGWD